MFILSSLSVSEDLLFELTKKFPNATFSFSESMDEAKIELHKAEILITYGEDLTEELIEEATKLKWIMVMSAGMERMPFEAIKKKRILVTNARGIHKIPMAEYTLAMMLQYSRKTNILNEQQTERIWDRTTVHTFELFNKSVAILGVGAIGGEIARLCKAFNMRVIGVNSTGNEVSFVDQMYTLKELNDVVHQADFIVSVLPSTNETKYLLKKHHFEQMKNGVVLINIGRGDLVEEQILVDALFDGHVAHAVLDVFEEEPLPEEHQFWGMKNVTVTPHVSSYTKNYLPRCFVIFQQNLMAYIKGGEELINKIDLDRGY